MRVYNVLFLCTGNSARSILAEALLDRMGEGRFRTFSAGSFPRGEVHPQALSFARPGAPELDFIFTVCDAAAGETCPIWPGHPMTAHWGIEDPARVEGPRQSEAFARALNYLSNRISLFLALPIEGIDRMALGNRLDAIGREGQGSTALAE
jgi:protein-tyrosine-phosphatase